MITLNLLGQMPSGKNAVNVTRTGHRYPNQRFVTWREKAMWEVRMQLKGKSTLSPSSKIYMECWYWPGDLRRRDVPGMEDALCHLLEKMGIVDDDALICDQNFHTMELDRQNPRIRIQLSEKEIISPKK